MLDNRGNSVVNIETWFQALLHTPTLCILLTDNTAVVYVLSSILCALAWTHTHIHKYVLYSWFILRGMYANFVDVIIYEI